MVPSVLGLDPVVAPFITVGLELSSGLNAIGYVL